MKAVDSEFNQSLQSDAWKFFSLLQHSAFPESNLNRFNIGNSDSLKQEGIREALLEFHKTWYSSNIMKLCVTGKFEVEEVEKLVVELFSQVPNKDVEVPALNDPPAFD